MLQFGKDLQVLINQNSKENDSNTPDFILSDYLVECLNAFNRAVTSRNEWYKPGGAGELTQVLVRLPDCVTEIVVEVPGFKIYKIVEPDHPNTPLDWVIEINMSLYNVSFEYGDAARSSWVIDYVLIDPKEGAEYPVRTKLSTNSIFKFTMSGDIFTIHFHGEDDDFITFMGKVKEAGNEAKR